MIYGISNVTLYLISSKSYCLHIVLAAFQPFAADSDTAFVLDLGAPPGLPGRSIVSWRMKGYNYIVTVAILFSRI